MSNEDSRVLVALERFDAVNATDPTLVEDGGERVPRELLFARRLEAWVQRVEPNPSLALRLAARCQHLGRFLLPRSSFPEGRVGYLAWRKEQGRVQSARAIAILRELGFAEDVQTSVQGILTKQGLKTNSDVQTMEDALCLSFLEHEFVPFLERVDDAKAVDIVQKTWRKMSERGHALALALPLGGRAQALVLRALGG